MDGLIGDGLKVGEAAARTRWSPRMLRYIERAGLVVPRRTPAGYRLYTAEDITRMQHVVVYRRLGFPLEEIALLLDEPSADVSDATACQAGRPGVPVVSA